MQYKSAVVNGLIQDFATVVAFLIDILVFKVGFSLWSVVGCVLVAFVVISISVEKGE